MNPQSKNALPKAKKPAFALSQWDTEGGAGPLGPQEDLISGDATPSPPDLANVELVQMRVRIIALENLVLALLAGASTQQLQLARAVAANIVPRPGFGQHPLTLKAATQMHRLIGRGGQFRDIN